MAGHCSRHLAAVTLRSVFVIGAFQPSVAFIEISSSPFSAHRFRHARTAGTVVPHYNSQRCRPVREDLRTATASMASDTGFKSSSFDWEGQWSKGLGKGDMWDTGIVSPALQDLLHTEVLPKGRAFVPGCGRGYEAIAFGRSGYDCIGLDLSPSGIEEAKSLLAEEKESMNGKVEFRAEDFFKFTAEEEGKFDVILDYTFLCAIDPSAREAWADRMVSLLEPAGELVTLIFPIVKKEGGPPFAMSEDIVSGLLEPRGLTPIRLEKLPQSLCHPSREGKTALGRWRFASSSSA